MEQYERLIAVVDAFIGTFGGALRLQGIQTLLLIEKATLYGTGIKPSELHRLTGAPLENIRRRLLMFNGQGLIAFQADPTDDRSTLCTMTEAGRRTWPAADVARRLYVLRPANQQHPAAPHPMAAETYDALIAILRACAEAFGGGMRIRGFKTALLIQQATVGGEGITASAISRRTDAPLETVRRHMIIQMKLGNLRFVEDPRDDRAARIYTADPERERQTYATLDKRLDALNWQLFNIS